MKLLLTITLAVFLGDLAALSVFEAWRTSQAQKAAELESRKLAEQQQIREEQGAKVRQMLLNGHQGKGEIIDNGDIMLNSPNDLNPNKTNP